jgi:hypothetical protein
MFQEFYKFTFSFVKTSISNISACLNDSVCESKLCLESDMNFYLKNILLPLFILVW